MVEGQVVVQTAVGRPVCVFVRCREVSERFCLVRMVWSMWLYFVPFFSFFARSKLDDVIRSMSQLRKSSLSQSDQSGRSR